jgi:GTPase SAR1 family protein
MKVCAYTDSYNPTVGTAFVPIPCVINQCETTLAVWDTAGEHPNAVTRQFYRGAHVAFLCFDLSSKISFEHFHSWHNFVLGNCADSVLLFLVGCKSDLGLTVDNDEIRRICRKLKMEYWSTSAKEALQIRELVMRTCVLGVAAQLQEHEPSARTRASQLRAASDKSCAPG